jgi:hypothetical protein
MRQGFSMLMALAVIVVVSTVSVLVLNLSGKMAVGTTAGYRQEQAALLARSYAELALLSVINQDINTTCINDINSTVDNLVPNGSAGDTIYTAAIRITYLGTNLPAGCSMLNAGALATDYNSTTLRGVAAVLIDVFIRYSDSDISPDNNLTYHLRRLEKI